MYTIFDDVDKITIGRSIEKYSPMAIRIYRKHEGIYLNFYLSNVTLSIKSQLLHRFHRTKIKSLNFKSI